MPYSDPDAYRAYMRDYMRERREQGLENLDPQKEADRKRRWYEANRERKRENERRWRARKKQQP